MPKEQKLDVIQINRQDTFKQLFDVDASKLHLMRSKYMICIYNTATKCVLLNNCAYIYDIL